MHGFKVWFLTGAVLATATLLWAQVPTGPKKAQLRWEPASNWASGAPTTEESFKRIEHYLRGFDQPMWEVGERWSVVHDAVSNKNYELAAYHWDKIGITIVNGYLKRPKRQANADAMFMEAVFPEFKAALESKDEKKIRAVYDTAYQTCMACHVAEKVGFINDQELFRKTAKLAPKK